MNSDSLESETPPPKGDANIAKPPELNVGDKIRTVHFEGKARTLTVKKIGHNKKAKTIDSVADEHEYVLEGYGTEYYLTTSRSLTDSWQRVDLVYKSRPEGETVHDIEIIERSVNTGES